MAVEDGRPVMTHFTVGRRPGGSAVTASFIHGLPVGDLFDQLVAYLDWGADLMQKGYDDPNVVHLMPKDDERQAMGARAVASQRGRLVSDEDLRKVAEIVVGNDYDPRKEVVRQLHLSDRTASRWIAEARRKGFLTKEVDENG